MDDYSQPLSFGATSGQRSQPIGFQATPQDRIQEYKDSQLEDKRLYGYDKDQPMSSFQYSDYIPGFSASPMTSNIAAIPTRKFREPSSYQSPVIAPNHNGRHESSRFSVSQRPKPYQQKSHVHELSPRIALAENTASSNTATLHPIEDGELSEGEYQEVGTGPESNVVPAGEEQYNQLDGRSALAHHALPIKIPEHEVELTDDLVDEYGRSLALNGRSAASYSPRKPPTAHHGPRRTWHEPHPVLRVRTESVHGSEHRRGKDLENQRVNNLQNSAMGSNTEQNHSILAPLHPPIHSSNTHQRSLTLQSVHDARREAQNAILNLWPFKVRLQNYIDEGIDGDIVRRQFEELGMLQAPLMDKRTDHIDNITRGTLVDSTSTSPSNIRVEQSPPLMKTITSARAEMIGSKPVNRDKGEQDRIANSLTKNNQKLASPIMKESETSISPEEPTPKKLYSNPLSAAKADKERLLQQKMEALQKSREQRAQKAAAKNSTSAPAVTSTVVSQASIIQPSKDTISALQQPVNYPVVESVKPISTSPSTYSAGVTKLSIPTIPGLFLAASTSTTQTSPSSFQDMPSLTVNNNVRKRPVASDFDSSIDLYKRPFGQSRNEQRLVIDVSEDESDGESSEMEVDSKLDDKSTNDYPSGSNNAKLTTIRDLQPLTDTPQRKQFQTPKSATGTPTQQSLNKSTIPNPEDLLKKEMEIQKMKKKIEEAERKQRAKMNLSGSQTPRSNESTSSTKSANETMIVDKVEASIQIERLIDDASRKFDEDQQKAIEIHISEQTAVNELNGEEEKKALKRAKIASDLPVVDAEVAKSQKKLAEMRAEMAQLEVSIQQGLEVKKRLAEEMDKLSQESDVKIQEHQEKLQGGTNDDAGSDSDIIFPSTQAIENNNRDCKLATPPVIMNNTLPNIEPTSGPHSISISDITNNSWPDAPKATSIVPDDEAEPELEASLDMSNDLTRDHGDLPYRSPDHIVETVLSDVSPNAEPHSQGTESDVDMEDSYASDSNNPTSALTTSSIGKNEQESGLTGGIDIISQEGGESDPYEPPEASNSTSGSAPSNGSSPFSPAPPELGSQKSQTDLHPQISSPLGTTGMTLTVSPASNYHVIPLTKTATDRDTSVGTTRKSYFTPYESPLKKFRAYRFHPAFEKEVAGGFKSLTYSNNIKEDQELCRYELGGVCNDNSCEFQHFKTMGLADDAILVELGNSAGYREEDKPRFVSGLRAVLQDLRRKKTKDFQVIAAEIAAFRARFHQDKSKVILLDG